VRVLITTAPGYGHFHPLVPLARALVVAGHDVLVATAASLHPAVAAAGLPCAAAGAERAEFPAELRQRVQAARGDWKLNLSLAQSLFFFGFRARRMAPDVLRLVDEYQPDVLLRDPVEYGGYIAAEVRGIPHVASGAGLFGPPWMQATIEESLAELRAEYRLAPDPTAASLHRYLTLAPLPRSWVAPDEPVPPTTVFLRPEPFNSSGHEALPTELERLPANRPWVHASLGTVHNDAPGIYEAMLAGLREEPLNLILTVGRDRDPAEFGPQPPNVVIARYIPHELLLPRCMVMLTHCGFSSIMACLTLGVPMVGVPIAADQPFNATRLTELGAATVVWPEKRSPEAFRDAVRTVLSDPAYRRSVEAIRDEVAAMPGSDLGVQLIEQLSRERAPIASREESSHSPGEPGGAGVSGH
jgi:UDP:flavonoid glycosyltransferase YjiC (YdhE family)